MLTDLRKSLGDVLNQQEVLRFRQAVIGFARRRPRLALAAIGCTLAMFVGGAGCACAMSSSAAGFGSGRQGMWNPNMNDNFHRSDVTDTTIGGDQHGGYIGGDGFTYSWGG